MRIQHNITAMNSYRNYTNNTSAVAKNLEKLSSGYKINRAGDDAAGLAISEKMRAQITGLQTAQKNAKDGISLVKTAEGALTEVHDMLNRMYELAEQSSNGTYDNEVDRANLQKEITSLKSEIDRIADSANFNGIKLLDGTMGSSSSGSQKLNVSAYGMAADGTTVATFDKTTTPGTKGSVTITAIDEHASDALAKGTAYTVTMTNSKTGETKEIKMSLGDAVAGSSTGSGAVSKQIGADLADNDTLSQYFDFTTAADGTITVTNKDYDQTWTFTGISSNDATIGSSNSANPGTTEVLPKYDLDFDTNGLTTGATFSVNGNKYEIVASEDDAATKSGYTAITLDNLDKTLSAVTGATVTHDADKISFELKTDTTASGGDGSLTLQIGDTAEDFNKLTVSVRDMHAGSLGIGSVDISTQNGASSAMASIKSAINIVSSVRGDLGATQNRLEHTINNLSVMTENIQDAESSIRDVDVAEEMMAYTKNNILVQSAQAMLAQANQLPQGVLQLLQ